MSGLDAVAVLGLGKMGAALADALLATGHAVTLWNRTAAKAEAFARSGATIAGEPAEAVRASAVVVACLDDVDTCRELLADADLRGRVLVQVTSGTPEELQALESWATERGAELIEGMILVYPSMIGSENSRILYGGSDATIERARSVLDAFGGFVHVGREIGSVSSLALAVRAFYLISSTTLVACLDTAQRLGAPLDKTLEELALQQAVAFEGVAASQDWILGEPPQDGTERVTLARLAESSAAVGDYLTSRGIDTRILDAVRHHLEQAVSAGEAESPIGAVARVLGGSTSS